MRLSWSVLLVAATVFTDVEALTLHVDNDFSIGSQYPLSEDRRTIKGYSIFGNPQLLSDRILLTPPAPGNQRVGLWGNRINTHEEWTASLDFRVSGSERPGGSLHIWYSQRGANGGSQKAMDTIYTSQPFDGFVLVIDSHTGPGGLRAYLNDGQTDYSRHHHPTSLAFAHCDFDYRNKGSLSRIVLTQNKQVLKVEVDGDICFQTDKVRLPTGYYFGITAATSETPDSFEMFNFLLAHPPKDAAQGDPAQGGEGKPVPKYQNGQVARGRTPGKQPQETKFKEQLEDHEASYYKTQEEQFTDIHNRLQTMTHHLSFLQSELEKIYGRVDGLHHKGEESLSEMRGTRIPREQIDKMDHRLTVIENLSMQIAGAITSKDYTHHFEELRNTLKEHHTNLLYAVPDTMSQVLASGGPKIGMMVTVVVLVQVALAVGYVVYKRRRNSSPKKYL